MSGGQRRAANRAMHEQTFAGDVMTSLRAQVKQ
jgi:hypothetical protein